MAEVKSCFNCKSFIPNQEHWCGDRFFTMYLFDISVCDEEFPEDASHESIAGYYGRNCQGFEYKAQEQLNPSTIENLLQSLPEDSVYRKHADLYLEEDDEK